MTFNEQVTGLLQAALDSRPDLFLIECKISGENHISILLDGDYGVNLQSCVEVSRQIEHNLDEMKTTFHLRLPRRVLEVRFKKQDSMQKTWGASFVLNEKQLLH